MTELPARAPLVTAETKEFWDATAEGRLLIKRCTACSQNYWYPRTLCPFCGSVRTEWLPTSGRGTIYSFSVTRKGAGDFADAAPYVLAYVELEEGPRIMTNIIDCDVEAIAIGDEVSVRFQSTDGESALYRFAPVAGDDR